MAASQPTIIVHDLAQALAALGAARAAERAVTLRSAPGAAHYAGLGFLRTLFEAAAEAEPEAAHDAIIDCGDDAALAHEALRLGIRRIAFSGGRSLGAKLADIASQSGAALVIGAPPKGALDLRDSANPARDCADLLTSRSSGAR